MSSEFPSSFNKWPEKEKAKFIEEVEKNRELRRREKEDPNYGKHDWLFEKWKKERRGSRTRRFLNALREMFPTSEKQEKYNEP